MGVNRDHILFLEKVKLKFYFFVNVNNFSVFLDFTKIMNISKVKARIFPYFKQIKLLWEELKNTIGANDIGVPKMLNNFECYKIVNFSNNAVTIPDFSLLLLVKLSHCTAVILFCFSFGISSLLHFWYHFFASFLLSVLCLIFVISSLLKFWYQFFA